ncbi:MAG: hypothetical protein LBH49_00965 [Puniceicoccales bacterium]|jgi:serine/threonine protein kinase|nr:hypothetical protein [Puniceicoccales bacterium]
MERLIIRVLVLFLCLWIGILPMQATPLMQKSKGESKQKHMIKQKQKKSNKKIIGGRKKTKIKRKILSRTSKQSLIKSKQKFPNNNLLFRVNSLTPTTPSYNSQQTPPPINQQVPIPIVHMPFIAPNTTLHPNQPKINLSSTDYKNANLFWDNMVCQVDPSKFDNCSLKFDKLIGQGGFGQVWSGSILDTTGKTIKKVIIKTALKQTMQPYLKEEHKQSNALALAIKNEIYNPSPENQNGNKQNPSVDFGKFQGAAGIVHVLGRGFLNIQSPKYLVFNQKNGNAIIQELVAGENLFDALQVNPATAPLHPPYNAKGGHPSDLYGALRRTLSLAAEVMAIHSAGYVHNDLKEANIMILNDSTEAGEPIYPTKIIDLGAIKKIGETVSAFSNNGGPELMSSESKKRTLEGLKNKIAEHNANLSEMKKNQDKSNPKLKENIDKTIMEINKLNKIYNDISLLKSHPSYDIYSMATVFPPILFGFRGLCLSYSLFTNYSKQYLTEIKKMNFDERIKYFENKLFNLNNIMRKDTGNSYDDQTIKALASLLAWMLTEEPYLRPNAAQVFNQLQDILDQYYASNSKNKKQSTLKP